MSLGMQGMSHRMHAMLHLMHAMPHPVQVMLHLMHAMGLRMQAMLHLMHGMFHLMHQMLHPTSGNVRPIWLDLPRTAFTPVFLGPPFRTSSRTERDLTSRGARRGNDAAWRGIDAARRGTRDNSAKSTFSAAGRGVGANRPAPVRGPDLAPAADQADGKGQHAQRRGLGDEGGCVQSGVRGGGCEAVVLRQSQQVVEVHRAVAIEASGGPAPAAGDAVVLGQHEEVAEVELEGIIALQVTAQMGEGVGDGGAVAAALGKV
jgi:hypothetical protein